MKFYRFALLTSFLSFSSSIIVLDATTKQIVEEEEYETNSYEDETTIAWFDSRLPWKKIVGKAFAKTVVAYNLFLAGRFTVSQLFLNFVMPCKNDFAQIPLKEFLSLPQIAAILPFKCLFNSKDKYIKTIVSSFKTHKIQRRHEVWLTCSKKAGVIEMDYKALKNDLVAYKQLIAENELNDVNQYITLYSNDPEHYQGVFDQGGLLVKTKFLADTYPQLSFAEETLKGTYPLSSGLRTMLIEKYTENSFVIFCSLFTFFLGYEYYQARKELANTL